MKLRTLGRLTTEGSSNIAKGGWMSVASIVTVSISLFVLALLALLALNMQYVMQTVQEELQVVAYLPDEISAGEGQEVAATIASFEGVREVQFVSKEQALERLRDIFGDHNLEAVEESNPLPHSVEIWVGEAADIPAVAQRIETETVADEVFYQPEVVESINRLATALQMAGVALVALMMLATIFVIANTIRLTVHARRDEIKIMSLVGATDGFIRLPFLIEGVLLGMLGAAAAGGAVWGGYVWLSEQVGRSLPFMPMLHPDPITIQLAQFLLIAGVLVGLVGSTLSLRRYLHVQGG